MSKISSLSFPKKSHRKEVRLPNPSPRLAEFFGIMMGDGGINNPWQANITVNAIADAEYESHLRVLSEELFGITPAVRKRKNREALVISLASTTLVDFLVARGLPRGNKIAQGLKIPAWILRNVEFQKACVRGLIDTDGCLFIHKHKIQNKLYQNIGLCFSSRSHVLLKQIAGILENFGIAAHIDKRHQNVYLYKAAAVAKYLEIFGTSNKRIQLVYRKWRGA